jgi:hypothetical protein
LAAEGSGNPAFDILKTQHDVMQRHRLAAALAYKTSDVPWICF